MNRSFLCLFILLIGYNSKGQEFALKTYNNYTNTAIAKRDVDINNDGYLDHIVLNEIDGTVVLYENVKDLFFNQKVILANTEKIAKDIEVGDLNNDGKAEVVLSFQGNATIRIYRYTLVGTLQETTVLKNSLQGAIALYDVDLDGQNDIVSHYNSFISYHINKGDLTFGGATKVNLVANITGIYTAHLHNKSILSYTLSDFTLGQLVLVNQVLTPKKLLTLDKFYNQPKITDFDKDDRLEIYCNFTKEEPTTTGVTGQQILVVWEEDSTGTFTRRELTSNLDHIYDYNVIDLEDDNQPELIISHTKRIYNFYFSDVYHHIAIFKNNDQHSFVKDTFFEAGSYCRELTLVNKVNGDKALAFVSYGNNYLAYLEDINGKRALDIKANVCQGDNDFIFTDFDKNGVKDILMARNATLNKYTFNLYQNEYKFTKLKAIQIPSTQGSLKVIQIWFKADFNQDGIEEIVATAGSESLYLYNYIADSMQAIPLALNLTVDGCLPYDMDNDGDLDIVLFGDLNSFVHVEDYHLSILENKGNFVFERKVITPKIQGKHTEIIDINNDGLMDMLSSECKDYVPFGELNPTYLYLYINNGNLNFTRSIYNKNIASEYFKLVDIDRDSDKDIVSINDNRSKISLYINNNGIFSEMLLSNIPTTVFNDFEIFDAGDIDKDGDIDIVAYINEMVIFEFKSNYNFTKTLIASGINKNATNLKTIMEVEDIDLDGDDDVIRIKNNNQFEIYFNVLNKSKIVVSAFFDENENGVMDAEEHYYPDFNSYIAEIENDALFKRLDGHHNYYVDDGAFTIVYDSTYNKNWALTTAMSQTINTENSSQHQVLFGLRPRNLLREVIPAITSSITRCNTTAQFYLSLTNTGTTILNGTLICDVTSKLLNKSYHQPVDKITSNKLEYKVKDFYPGASIYKSFSGRIPGISSFYPVGTKLDFKLTFVSDDSTYQQSSAYQSILRCSYDPNDKLASPDRPDSTFLADEYLHYTIRFQNTGNDTAFQVVIRDTLQEGYEANTFRIINSSHMEHLQHSIKDNKYLEFAFKDIILPDSTTNFLRSQGFVTYSIKCNNDLRKGDQVRNTAHIYFDLNPAIVTNTRVNILTDKLSTSIAYIDDGGIVLYPNPFAQNITIKGHNAGSKFVLMGINGSLLSEGRLQDGEASLDFSELATGIYIFHVASPGGQKTYKLVKL